MKFDTIEESLKEIKGDIKDIKNMFEGLEEKFVTRVEFDTLKEQVKKNSDNQNLYWYELSTPYNLSTITNSGSKNLGGNNYGLGLWYNNTGTIAFCANGNYNTITKYTL